MSGEKGGTHIHTQSSAFFYAWGAAVWLTVAGAPSDVWAASHHSKGACAAVFSTLSGEELAKVKPEFMTRHLAIKDRLTVEVEDTPVKDQCRLGTCWVFGTVSALEKKIKNHYGRPITISEPYLVVQSLRARSLALLEVPHQRLAFGGTYQLGILLAGKHGLVPKSVWQPRIAFETAPHAGRLTYFLDTRIQRFHIESANLKNPAEREALIKQAKKDVLDIIESYSGPLPTAFDFEGVHYPSPKAFAQRVLPEDRRKLKVLTAEGGTLPEDMKATAEELSRLGAQQSRLTDPNDRIGISREIQDAVAHSGLVVERRSVPLDEMEQEILASLRDGESVPFTFEDVTQFHDNSNGVMSIEAFHTPPGFAPLNMAYRQAFSGFNAGYHLVDIVGAVVDQRGQPVFFKIRNSWGLLGDRGYFYMYRDYFRAFATNAYLRRP